MSNNANVPGITNMQHIDFTSAAKHVVAVATAYEKATYLLVSSIAVTMIAGAYPAASKNDKGEMVTPKAKSWDDTMTLLKADLVPTGLKQAMVYRYIALAKKLCIKMVKTEGRFGGTIGHVLMCRTAKGAVELVYDYIVAKVGDKGTLDTLNTFVTETPTTGTQTGSSGPTTPAIKASTSAPDSIVARLVKEPSILANVAPETVMAALPGGDDTKVKFLDKAIDALATPEALHHVMEHAKARLEEMAKAAPEAKAKEQPAPRQGRRSGTAVKPQRAAAAPAK